MPSRPCGLNAPDRNVLLRAALSSDNGFGVKMGGQIVSYASVKLESTTAVARSANSIGGVLVYGLSELQCAKPHTGDFVEAWRDAICSEIGSEEFEKFCLERREKSCGRRARRN